MKSICALLLSLTLGACGKSVPSDTLDSLAANPGHLKQIMRQCREDHAKMVTPCVAERAKLFVSVSWVTARANTLRSLEHNTGRSAVGS